MTEQKIMRVLPSDLVGEIKDCLQFTIDEYEAISSDGEGNDFSSLFEAIQYVYDQDWEKHWDHYHECHNLLEQLGGKNAIKNSI